MDIELARTFLAVVETGSFLDAAARVHVTQSTVSMRIRSLEQQLGRALFQRGRSGASLTAAGRHFHRHAQTLVRAWSHAKLDVGLPEPVETMLEIGAQHSLWDALLIHAIGRLRARRPSLAIKASTGFSDTLMRDLSDGALDLAVMYRPQIRPGFAVERLFDDDLVLVTSDDLERDSGYGADPGYVFVDWGPEFRADHALNFPQAGAPSVQLDLGTLGLQYLIANKASGYFPRRVVERELASGRLRLRDDAPRFSYAAFAVYPEATQDDSLHDALDVLRGLAAAL